MIIATFFTIILFLIFNLIGYAQGIFLLSILQVIILVWFGIRHSKQSLILIVFTISFFTFYQGRDLIFFLFPHLLDKFGMKINIDFENQISKFNTIYLSILFIGIGFLCIKNKFKTYSTYSIESITYNPVIKRLRKILLWIFYITIIFTISKIILVGSNVLAGNYAKIGSGIAVSQSTNLLSFLNTYSYIAYLCCFPTKEELKKSIWIFICITILSILTGSRGDVVNTILFLLVYFLSRDFYQKKENRFLSKRLKISLILFSPIAVVGLSLFAFIRIGSQVESYGFFYDILGFFIQQGGSSSLITLGDNLKSSLPQTNISYTFGPLINLINGYINMVPSVNTDNLSYVALYGNNLGATLTFLTEPRYYYNGGGLGTAYIAELYVDFGELGVVIYSFFLGMLIRYVSFDIKKTLLMRIISSFIIIGLIFIPRDFALNFIKILTPAYIICFIGTIGLFNYISRYQNKWCNNLFDSKK